MPGGLVEIAVDASELIGWGEAMAANADRVKAELPGTVYGVAQVAANIAADAAPISPGPVDTGWLKAGIVALPGQWVGDGAQSAFVSTAPYSRAVEEGRRGFSAKNAKALRFEIDGKVIFRRSVGPAAPKPFMKHGREYAEKQLANRVRAKLMEIAGGG